MLATENIYEPAETSVDQPLRRVVLNERHRRRKHEFDAPTNDKTRALTLSESLIERRSPQQRQQQPRQRVASILDVDVVTALVRRHPANERALPPLPQPPLPQPPPPLLLLLLLLPLQRSSGNRLVRAAGCTSVL
jgi:hypothetical protein